MSDCRVEEGMISVARAKLTFLVAVEVVLFGGMVVWCCDQVFEGWGIVLEDRSQPSVCCAIVASSRILWFCLYQRSARSHLTQELNSTLIPPLCDLHPV